MTINLNSINFDALETLNKSQLIEIIQAQHAKLSAPRSNKKYDVLAILRTGRHSVQALADQLDITTKNVSSLLTYLRKQDGIIIHTDHEGNKYMPDPEQQPTPAETPAE